jgi:beta-glucanase (GH16 family)
MAYNMKRRNFRNVAQCAALFLLIVIARPFSAQTHKKEIAKAADALPPGWELKFADEFNSSSIDYRKWSPHAPGKIVFGGQQTWSPAAITFSGGEAHLTAAKTANGYTSAAMTTLGSFEQKFGRFEIRFRMPAGAGLEPLLRLLPLGGADQPSIDVMRASGAHPSTALFANRWVEANLDRDYSGSWDGVDFSNGFHTVAAEWDEEKIVWSVDGLERFVSWDGIPQQPMYLTVCLEVRDPDARTNFPATLDIDYIRVFARP